MGTFTNSEDPDEMIRIQCYIRVCTFSFAAKHFVSSSPANHHFIWEQKEKTVRNFRTVTIFIILPQTNVCIVNIQASR